MAVSPAGKGDDPRPRQISDEEWRRRFDSTFLGKLSRLRLDGKPVVKSVRPTGTVRGQ